MPGKKLEDRQVFKMILEAKERDGSQQSQRSDNTECKKETPLLAQQRPEDKQSKLGFQQAN